MADEHSLHSLVREKILEHVFVGDCLRRLWSQGARDLEVLRADVDAGGYDVVMARDGITRYIQLKASFNGSKVARQTINGKLAEKLNGCVIWMGFDPDTMELGPFYWFGNPPGSPSPDLSRFRLARHTRGNKEGHKPIRRNSFVLPKGDFVRLETIDDVLEKLFG